MEKKNCKQRWLKVNCCLPRWFYCIFAVILSQNDAKSRTLSQPVKWKLGLHFTWQWTTSLVFATTWPFKGSFMTVECNTECFCDLQHAQHVECTDWFGNLLSMARSAWSPPCQGSSLIYKQNVHLNLVSLLALYACPSTKYVCHFVRYRF